MAIDEEHFPDEVFRAYVSNDLDTDGDGTLSDEEIGAVTSISVNNKSISSLKGIEYFTALMRLYCYSNRLAELDLSNNTSLTTLSCSFQTITLPADSIDITLDTSYPYSLTLTDINASIDIDRISSLNVVYSNNPSATFSTSGATLYFSAIPSEITYNYDTKLSSDTTHYMDVTIKISDTTNNNPPTPYDLSLSLIPSTQTLTPGSTITPIVISADNISGDLVWNFSGGFALGLTSSDNSITGTIPSGTTPGNYTITVTAWDSRNDPATATATIQVVADTPSSGITGIAITNPASKTRTLSSTGGTFTATVTASGTPNGALSWDISPSSGLTVTPTYSGNTAELSITVPANTTATARTYTVGISAHDDSGETFSDTLTITVGAGGGGNTPAGITGITITNPASKTTTLSSTGGTFTATVTASGTPSGALSWDISPSDGLTVTPTYSGNTAELSITVPANTTTAARTYTVGISAHDDSGTVFSDTLTITVGAGGGSNNPAGITGITITNPASKTATLSSTGGTFTATVTASGTPSGAISWDISPSDGLTVTPTYSGNTAELSITVPANTTTAARTYTVGISAHDDSGTVFSDTLTITVSAPVPSASNYTFTMTESLRNGILSAFPGFSAEDIHQLSDSEILSGTWTVGNDDLQELSGLNERDVLNLPAIMPQNSGVYVLRLTLTGVTAGGKIHIHGISEGEAGFNASKLSDVNYAFLDADGNIIDTVPDDRVVYAAMVLSAGEEIRSIVATDSSGTADDRLALGTVIPVDEGQQAGLGEIIAQELSISADVIKFLEEENISPAPDPDQEVIDRARIDDYDIIGKLGTIHVEESGYYVFKIVLSEDLFRQIESLDIDQVAMYTSPVINASFMVNGLVSTWELLTVSGRKFDKFNFREFLMVGFLNAGQPFTLFLAKAILSLLTGGLGGCNAGVGLACLSAVVFTVLRRKKH